MYWVWLVSLNVSESIFVCAEQQLTQSRVVGKEKARPISHLTFAALSEKEINVLNAPLELSSDSEEEQEGLESDATSIFESSPPLEGMQLDSEAEKSNWKSLDLIPSYVPPFLPPFPGMELQLTSDQTNKKKRDRIDATLQETKRKELESKGALARMERSDRIGNPWTTVIPYSSSAMASMHINIDSLPTLSPPPSPRLDGKRIRRPRSISPIFTLPIASTSEMEIFDSVPVPKSPSSSLRSFRENLPELLALQPSYLPPSKGRFAAAATLSTIANIFTTGDTLFGSIPIDRPRSALLQAGFLPDHAPIRGDLHAYNSPLPHTISQPIPLNPSPSINLIAPPIHSRLPNIMSKLRTHFASPLMENGKHLPMFSRMGRIGPPGPLNPSTGKTENYRFAGNTRLIALENIEVRARYFNARLPKTDAEKEKERELLKLANLAAEAKKKEEESKRKEEEKIGFKLKLARPAATPTEERGEKYQFLELENPDPSSIVRASMPPPSLDNDPINIEHSSASMPPPSIPSSSTQVNSIDLFANFNPIASTSQTYDLSTLNLDPIEMSMELEDQFQKELKSLSASLQTSPIVATPFFLPNDNPFEQDSQGFAASTGLGVNSSIAEMFQNRMEPSERSSTAPLVAPGSVMSPLLEHGARAVSLGFSTSEPNAFTNDSGNLNGGDTFGANDEYWGMQLDNEVVIKQEDSLFQF